MKYIYPAIFSFDKADKEFPNGVYEVSFPDLPGCYTCGETLEEAYDMAEDVLNLFLWSAERDKEAIPVPSPLNKIKADNSSDIVTLIKADTLEYSKKYDNSAVKKTLSIPRWLNVLASEKGVNFSNILQQALMKELNVTSR